METAKKFTLSAADLIAIHATLTDSLTVLGDWSVPKHGRSTVNDKILSILHGMEATFTVNSEEPQ